MPMSTEVRFEVLKYIIISFTNNCWKNDPTSYPNQEKRHKRQSQHFVKRFKTSDLQEMRKKMNTSTWKLYTGRTAVYWQKLIRRLLKKHYKGNSRKWLNNDQVKLEQIKWLQDASFWLEIDTLFSINHFKLQFARWIIQSQNNCWHKPFLDLSHLDIFCLLSVNNQARSKNDYPCHLCPTDSEFQRLHWTYFIT